MRQAKIKQPRRINLRAAEAFLILAEENSTGPQMPAEQITALKIALTATRAALNCETPVKEEEHSFYEQIPELKKVTL